MQTLKGIVTINQVSTDVFTAEGLIRKHVSKDELIKEYATGRRDFSREEFESQMYLNGANLEGINLNDAKLNGACMIGANLKNASFRNANLKWMDFSNAKLQGADLHSAQLQNANLYGANLENANIPYASLENACLRRVSFKNANLRGANLKNANLEEVYFGYANLIDAEGLDTPNTIDNIKYAIFEHTQVTEKEKAIIADAILQGKFDVINSSTLRK